MEHLHGFRVITYDAPGIGSSQVPSSPMSMRALADIGAGILDGGVRFSYHGSGEDAWPARIRTDATIPVLVVGVPGEQPCLSHHAAYPGPDNPVTRPDLALLGSA